MTPTTWQECFNPLLVTYRPAGSARRSITYTKLCNCAALTSFFRANVWRGQAEHLADSLSKGDRIMVTGRLPQRSWETPESDKRSVTELEADEVGASLKWATAKVERTSQRSNGERSAGRQRQPERGGDFDDPPAPF
jgi:single-strand DNA-binding protein